MTAMPSRKRATFRSPETGPPEGTDLVGQDGAFRGTALERFGLGMRELCDQQRATGDQRGIATIVKISPKPSF